MYTPDGITDRRRKEGVSYTAFEIFLIYCEHANQDTGLSRPTAHLISQRLGIRLDHVKKYDKELLTKLWVIEAVDGERRARKVQAGWLSRKERTKKPCATQTLVNQAPQDLGDLPNVGEELAQTLVNSPQDLGKSHQTLVTHIKEVTSQENQPNKPAKKKASTPAASAEDSQRFKWFVRELGKRIALPSNMAAQGRSIKYLMKGADNGLWTDAECVELLQEQLDDEGRTYAVSWLTVEKQIGTWAYKRKNPQRGIGNGTSNKNQSYAKPEITRDYSKFGARS